MNNKDKVWSVGMWVGVLLALFLLVISIKEIKQIAYVGRDVPAMNTISVNGKGEQFQAPDIATFSFGVTENAKTVDVAQTAATTKINAVLKALEDSGIEKKDIKTTSYNINPHYEYQQEMCVAGSCRSGRQVLTGYDVSQNVEVKVRDLTKAGSLFSTVGSLGVQNVNGLTFAIDKIEDVRAKARAEAIDDAQAKAKVLAKQLGVRIVRISSFYDAGDVQPYYAYGKGGMDMMSASVAPQAAPSIPSGEQKVTSQVTITYEIR
jgi:uncharacterized protein YggE